MPSITLVGIKFFVLNPDISIENDKRYMIKEFYPLLTNSQITGSLILLSTLSHGFQCIELVPHTAPFITSRTISSFKEYGEFGTLFQAEIQDSLKISNHQAYIVLFDQVKILMSMVPNCLLDYVEKDNSNKVHNCHLDLVSPFEALGGKTIAH